jgi:hypothetical protein
MARPKKTPTAPADRRLEHLPVATLKAAKRNPKDHDIGTLTQSIQRHGFVDAVILDERTGRLVSGHGRVEALRMLEQSGAEPPPGVQTSSDGWLVPVQRGWASSSDREAEAFLVAANRLVEAGGWNEDQLRDLLVDLASDGPEALLGTGYDGDDIDALLAEAKTKQSVSMELGESTWQVLVDVQDEQSQKALMERLEREGYKCRPMMF